MTKRLLIALCGLLAAAGCDDRKDGLKGFNDPPTISLKAERGGPESKDLRDSVKLSNAEYAYMPFVMRISDPNQNIKHVRMTVLSGTGVLHFRDETTRDTVRIVENIGTYRFAPDNAGTVIARFVVTDYFNASDSATLQLHVFQNLPPVAALETRYLGSADKNEYLLDGSGAYDADHDFGGQVHQYIFSVNNVIVAETTTPAIPYIFPGPGTYTVTLQVQDNDGAASKPVSLQLQVVP